MGGFLNVQNNILRIYLFWPKKNNKVCPVVFAPASGPHKDNNFGADRNFSQLLHFFRSKKVKNRS